MDKLNGYDIRLSIIVLVYNTEIYFNECLDTILAAVKKAKLNNLTEIIVINDGSKGNIKDIIKPYLKKNDNIIFVDKKNTGRGDSRNVGISKATGRYVHFIDSDDYIDEDIYVDNKKEILKSNVDVITFNMEATNKLGNKSIVYGKHEDIQDLKEAVLNEKIVASSCNKIIKKDMFNCFKYPVNIKYEDLAIVPAIVAKSNDLKYVNKEYYKYNFNENSAMRTKFNIDNFNLIEAIKLVFDNIDNIEDKNLNKQKIKLNIFACRFYEDILEQIMLVENKDEQMVYIKLLCDKIKGLESIFYTYSFKELLSKQNILKRYCAYYLIKNIANNNYNLVMRCLNKKIFYLLFFINKY